MTGRFGAGPLRGMSALLLLRAVAAAGLLAVLHALGVERAADDLVADAREVLHPAAAHEHDRVLLQVVADARDVRRHLDAAGEAHAGDLAQCGVGLLGCGRVHAGADAAPLRAALEGRRLGLLDLVLAALADQLLDGGHEPPSVSVSYCVVLGCLLGSPAHAVGCVAPVRPAERQGTHRGRSCAPRPDDRRLCPARPTRCAREGLGRPQARGESLLEPPDEVKSAPGGPARAALAGQPGVTTVGVLGRLAPSSTEMATPMTTASTTTARAVRPRVT